MESFSKFGTLVPRSGTSGGGGFGDPMTRDPAKVAEDVWNEKVSAVYARDYHGVVVDPATGVVNEAETASLRSMIVK
mgnify:CR=1 FL=1